ncbi:hypothetical protein KC340_g2593 [Hortaea werneckii]|nr:hypothetical protein KC342_g2555 [Hortaea werneckii]KAI7104415.1 hypothetical protein KC339_g4550 [Hortaea werneckii]KAI7245210.1 hypothetical protein KC365_g691 [Hortaea werneckii]KAI7334209.1 hypothetical protein KC340_g2593 [Hortaea werneckii]KAI7403852.1 hypothetical protein KC328_g2156 [Hortaea werneckii]
MPITRRAAQGQRNTTLVEAERFLWGAPAKIKAATEQRDCLMQQWMKLKQIPEEGLLAALIDESMTPQDLLDDLDLSGCEGIARRIQRGHERQLLIEEWDRRQALAQSEKQKTC